METLAERTPPDLPEGTKRLRGGVLDRLELPLPMQPLGGQWFSMSALAPMHADGAADSPRAFSGIGPISEVHFRPARRSLRLTYAWPLQRRSRYRPDT